jgi:16S rRNA (cytosine967-C5)-methyltransferase
MKTSFRNHHLLSILNEFTIKDIPLDVFLRNYFKKNKSIGSKDRKEICENLYKLIRFRGLIDYLCSDPITWEKRIQKLINLDYNKYFLDESIPIHIRLSFPKNYFEKVKEFYGLEKTIEFCKISNEPAPTTIRCNLIKTSRDVLYNELKEKYEVQKCQKSPWGIIFNKRINFFETEEFKNGFFEIQDEGSQLVANLIDPKPKDHVLDYCSGSGGKTLAFAHKLEKTGQIYLHDIRNFILLEAKKRFKRAGIENFQIKTTEELKKIKQKMDWIILDVPCSGSGTLRRNPDMKWKFHLSSLQNLTNLQRKIFDEAINYLNEDGKIVYITCSILPEENENQINFFIKNYNLKIENRFFSFPEKDSHDGFFACVLSR